MSLDSMLAVATRRASPDDAPLLADLARRTFVDAFAADNRPSDIDLYVAEAFGEEIQRAELKDPRIAVLLAERGEETVGYAMLREGPPPACVTSFDAIEIARLYAERRVIGRGVGAALMQHCLELAARRGKETVWLGVWEYNVRALAFYRRWGFRQMGTQPFLLGTDRQIDLVMARPVLES